MSDSESGAESGAREVGDYPGYSSHLRPRSRVGWAATLAFLGLFALAEPPLVYKLANRVEPWLLGMPFLYGYLLIIYSALIAVLIWAYRRGV